ncbi:hypothetical protein JCM4814A_00450 [Streptomyces phaeofaciens JCM 4814]|uniref:Uncharacterized protein n=1 Tax=Streptomyces phaeofaciens TaxID=68254 RepID=A0A918HSV7_9ACTN|nr:hypothetical protein GCM10010226_87890 [Streptomyces phaeofaciens]
MWEGQHPEQLVQGDAGTDGLDGAADVPAEHERWFADEYAGLAVVGVDRVRTRRVYPDQDLAQAGPRDRG